MPDSAKQTIAAEISAVDPGGEVMAREESFSEGPTVAVDVTLRGLNGASTMILGSGSDLVIRISAGFYLRLHALPTCPRILRPPSCIKRSFR